MTLLAIENGDILLFEFNPFQFMTFSCSRQHSDGNVSPAPEGATALPPTEG